MERPVITQETVHGNLGLQMALASMMDYNESLAPVIQGDKYYVDASMAGDGDTGKSWADAFKDLDTAFLRVSSGDRIYVAPGTYTGNYSTPDDTGARNVGVFGVNPGMPGIRGGVNLVAETSSSPIINIKASGWRFNQLCVRPGATSSGFLLTADISTTDYIAGLAGSISQGVTIDNCMIWGGSTGKYGIAVESTSGANGVHFANIINNHFMYLNATGAAGIYGSQGGNPNIGWRVIGNMFESNRSHINCYAACGWVGSRFEGNSWPLYGVYATATDGLVKVRATTAPDTTGGNVFAANFFGCNKTQYGNSDDHIRTNGYDVGMGNMCSDGAAAAAINH